MAEATPLGTEEFEAAFASVVPPSASGLVLAVSGGPDSMAMLHGLAGLDGRRLPPIMVATVDHGLRAGSSGVAENVRRAAAGLGLPCRILVWHGEKPARGLQAAARRARYGLLEALCTEIGADHLLTAHTADDQAETVLMRLARGSGITGLAAMRPRTALGAITLARPLLGIARARLAATCASLGVEVDHDPANFDPRFERARLRALAPLLGRAGLGCDALLRVARRSAQADDALAAAAGAALDGCRSSGRLSLSGLAPGPREILVRVLSEALAEFGGSPNRLERLERLAMRLAEAQRLGQSLRSTLGGVVVTLDGGGVLTLRREAIRRRGRSRSTEGPRVSRSAPPLATPPAGLPWQG